MRFITILSVFLIGGAFANDVWVEGQYLLWFIKNNPLPTPLVTTASYSDALPGALGQPHTDVVLGKKEIRMGWMNGFQVGAGTSVCSASYFLLPTASKTKSLTTSGEPGSPNFAVPIFDVSGVLGLNGVPGETILILPGPLFGMPGFFGRFDLRLSSQFQGAELNGLFSLFKKHHFQMEGVAGFRWFDLHEKLTFKAQTHSVPDFPFDPGFFNFADRFLTTNHFLAAQVGVKMQHLTEKWRLKGIVKGAIGATLQELKIKGSSHTSGGNLFFMTEGTANETLSGGIFAEPPNSGTHRKNTFAGAFEANLLAGYRINSHFEIHLGYTFLWISKLLRPGDQIDRKINSTLTALADASRATVGTGPGPIPFGGPAAAPAPSGPKKPSVLFKTSTFWAQGLDAGIQFNF